MQEYIADIHYLHGNGHCFASDSILIIAKNLNAAYKKADKIAMKKAKMIRKKLGIKVDKEPIVEIG